MNAFFASYGLVKKVQIETTPFENISTYLRAHKISNSRRYGTEESHSHHITYCRVCLETIMSASALYYENDGVHVTNHSFCKKALPIS